MSIFSNPFLIFALVWLIPLSILMNFDVAGYGLVWSDPVVPFIFINILIFFIVYILASIIIPTKIYSNKIEAITEAHISILEKYLNKLFKYWCIGYIIIIIASGGFPLLWIIVGDPRTYIDFGVPSLSGFLNMLRAFLSVSYVFIITRSDLKKNNSSRKVVFLIITAALLELARGNATFLLMHLLAMYFMLTQLRFKKLVIFVIALFSFLIVGSAISAMRYGKGLDYLLKQAIDYGMLESSSSVLFVAFIPVIVYMCLPIINLNYKLQHLPDMGFELYYLLQSLVPTVIRNFLFEKADYGLIVDEAHNVSSFFDPIVRDLGTIFCFGFLTFFYFIICFIYIAGRRGSRLLFFIYPCVYASLILSFFSMYFLTLVVILYPVPVYFWNKVIKRITHNPHS